MFNVSTQDVEAALTRNNIIATIGQTENANQRVDLLVNTSLTRAEEFERMVIRQSEGSLIRMRDVARVELGEEEGTVLGRLNHDNTVWLGVYPLPGANEIDIADALYVAIDEINADMPAGPQTRDWRGHHGLHARCACRDIHDPWRKRSCSWGLIVGWSW